ncbi:cytochrome P450, partial [Flammula alnicola]
PGPPPRPLVGHTFQVPSTKIWKYFEKLGLQYGPLVRLSLAGDDILVLNHPVDAEELLARRSNNYSSRKQLVYAGQYQSHNKRLVLLPYGPELKRQRAAFYQMLQPRMIGSYERMQEVESSKLLFDMLTHPEESNMNTKRYAASLVFTLSYGRRLPDDDEDLVSVLDILDGFIADCYPGAHLVDTFPVLDKILPSFLAPWRAAATKKHEKEMKLYTRLVLEVKKRMEGGEPDLECFSARLWEQQAQLDLDLVTISYVAGSAFEAGTGTTAASFLWFLMAMILYPETMRKAQAEIDAVVGSDGEMMPSFQDLDALPYTAALTKEVFRWMPAAPGGFPHYSDHDDEYKGFKIKAHTMVIPCIWSMQHNPAIFPNPLEFNPNRFLEENGHGRTDTLTEGHYAFGFGRRICPGRYLGSRSVWIGITRLLWAFNICPVFDKSGKPLAVDPDRCTSGITSEPEPFPVEIRPRSDTHSRTIRREW